MEGKEGCADGCEVGYTSRLTSAKSSSSSSDSSSSSSDSDCKSIGAMSLGCRGNGDGVGREDFAVAAAAASTGNSLGLLVREPRKDDNVFPPGLPPIGLTFDVSEESRAATFPGFPWASLLFRVLVRPVEGVDVVPEAGEMIPVSNACADVASSATATTSFALGFCLPFDGERRDASHLEPVRLLTLTGVVGPGECEMPPSSVTVVASEQAVLDPAETEDADVLDGPAAVETGGSGGLRFLVGEDAGLSLLRVKSLGRAGVDGGPFAAA